jgi:phospholipase C
MPTTRQPTTGLGSSKIDRIVIIFKENHTFDNYFGTFPGGNGKRDNRNAMDGRSSQHHRGRWTMGEDSDLHHVG